jgi:hypothetical protein
MVDPNFYLYPTASTVAVFINGLHVDQAYRLDYRDSIPKVPIYGYNDYEFTKVARGKGIVQGLLVINFIFAGYLTHILQSRRDAYVPRLYNYQLGPLDIQSDDIDAQLKATVKDTLQAELPPNTDSTARAARAEFISSLLSRDKSVRERRETKKALLEFFDSSALNVTSNIKEVNNPLTNETTARVGNQIDVYYQDPNFTTWFVRFEKVHFLDVSQQMSQAGAEGSSEPLYEIYNWIASKKVIKAL